MKALIQGVLALVVLAFSPLANAQDDFVSKVGLSVGAGGGVADFTGEEMRDATGTGGTWDARLVLGTKKLVGVELGYVGSLQAIDTLGLDSDAMLLSSGADAAVRVHLMPGNLQPYAFVGAGWRRYDLTNTDTNTSSVEDQDDVLEIPMGVGLAYTFDHVVVDVRGAYRPALDADLVPAATEGEDAPRLDTFQFTARIGYQF